MKALLLTLIFLGVDLGQIGAQTLSYDTDSACIRTQVIFDNDSTVNVRIDISGTPDSIYFKWRLYGTLFGATQVYIPADWPPPYNQMADTMRSEIDKLNAFYHSHIKTK